MIKPIITNIQELRQACQKVETHENIDNIIQDLKDTLIGCKRGWALSANQIGYNKQVAYVRMPKKYDPKTQQVTEYLELVLINPIIIEKDRKILVKKEECLSFPGILIDTDRFVFVTVEYENEAREKQTAMFQDMEAICLQHELDHLSGRTIFDRKHKAR